MVRITLLPCRLPLPVSAFGEATPLSGRGDEVLDPVEDGVEVVDDVSGPVADHPPSSRFDPGIPPSIYIYSMEVTINLDRESMFVASEIDNEPANWHLPSELDAEGMTLEV